MIGQLVIVDGNYVIVYAKSVDNKLEFFKVDVSGEFTLLNPSADFDLDKDFKPDISSSLGGGLEGKVEANLISTKENGMDIKIGNASADVSVGWDGISATAGASLVELEQNIFTYQDDLYIYGLDASVSFFSAEIGGTLSLDGIALSTPGLVGLSISGGITDLIDINVDL